MRPVVALAVALCVACGGEDPGADPGTAPAPPPAPSVEQAPAEPPATPAAAAPGTPRLPEPEVVPFKAKGLDNGDYAPQLVLTDLLTDVEYRLSDHLGPRATEPTRAAIIGFVASWCGPCRASLPTLKELKTEHGDDLQIVLLATDDDREGRLEEADHVRRAGLDAVVLDPTPEVLRAYKGSRRNVPHFFIVNKIGEVLVQNRGFGKKVKPMLPKQVRYALNNPDYVERKKKRRKKPAPKPASEPTG